MESNHPRNVTPRNSVLKTGGATGPHPPPHCCPYTAFFTSERGARWRYGENLRDFIVMKLPRITGDEVVRALKRAVVPVHAGKIVKPGTLSGILDDADLSSEDLTQLL